MLHKRLTVEDALLRRLSLFAGSTSVLPTLAQKAAFLGALHPRDCLRLLGKVCALGQHLLARLRGPCLVRLAHLFSTQHPTSSTCAESIRQAPAGWSAAPSQEHRAQQGAGLSKPGRRHPLSLVWQVCGPALNGKKLTPAAEVWRAPLLAGGGRQAHAVGRQGRLRGAGPWAGPAGEPGAQPSPATWTSRRPTSCRCAPRALPALRLVLAAHEQAHLAPLWGVSRMHQLYPGLPLCAAPLRTSTGCVTLESSGAWVACGMAQVALQSTLQTCGEARHGLRAAHYDILPVSRGLACCLTLCMRARAVPARRAGGPRARRPGGRVLCLRDGKPSPDGLALLVAALATAGARLLQSSGATAPRRIPSFSTWKQDGVTNALELPHRMHSKTLACCMPSLHRLPQSCTCCAGPSHSPPLLKPAAILSTAPVLSSCGT